MILTGFSHFHPFSSSEQETTGAEPNNRRGKALLVAEGYPEISTLQKTILQLLIEEGSLSPRAIGWRSGFSSETVREELLRLQSKGLVLVSSWGLLDEDWAITEKGKQKHMQLELGG